MTKLRVRYRNGQEDEFELREQHKPKDVAALLNRGMAGDATIVLGIGSRAGYTAAAYGIIGIRLSEVIMWELDPIADDGRLLNELTADQG